MPYATDADEAARSAVKRIDRGPLLKRAIQDRVKEFITERGLGPVTCCPPRASWPRTWV